MSKFVTVVLLFLWFMRNLQGANGRAMSFGKSRARLLTEDNKQLTFEDVAGIEESKEELQEIIEFLKHPGKFAKLGGIIPRGVLLAGPVVLRTLAEHRDFTLRAQLSTLAAAQPDRLNRQ